ncbi:MAG: hypothetical protein AAF802_04030 [Planctomycetota bacterium]
MNIDRDNWFSVRRLMPSQSRPAATHDEVVDLDFISWRGGFDDEGSPDVPEEDPADVEDEPEIWGDPDDDYYDEPYPENDPMNGEDSPGADAPVIEDDPMLDDPGI